MTEIMKHRLKVMRRLLRLSGMDLRDVLHTMDAMGELIEELAAEFEKLDKRTATTSKLYNRGEHMVIIEDEQDKNCIYCGFLMPTGYVAHVMNDEPGICCSYICRLRHFNI